MASSLRGFRGSCILLLVAVALASAASVATEVRRSLSSSKDINQILSTRSLKTGQQEEEIGQEERGISQMDDMVKLLKLDDGEEKLASNPNLKTFMDVLGKTPENGAIKSVAAAYGDDVVATILQTAKKVSSTKVMAEKMLAEQRILWLDHKLSPYDVFKLLKLDDAAMKSL